MLSLFPRIQVCFLYSRRLLGRRRSVRNGDRFDIFLKPVYGRLNFLNPFLSFVHHINLRIASYLMQDVRFILMLGSQVAL